MWGEASPSDIRGYSLISRRIIQIPREQGQLGAGRFASVRVAVESASATRKDINDIGMYSDYEDDDKNCSIDDSLSDIPTSWRRAVAVKKFRGGPHREGLPSHALRELSALQELSTSKSSSMIEVNQSSSSPSSSDTKQNPTDNIISLFGTYMLKGNVHAIQQLFDSDLYTVLHSIRELINTSRMALSGLKVKSEEDEEELESGSICKDTSDKFLYSTPFTHPFANEGMIESLFRGLMQAVSHIHSCGWFHRDIKPGNILLPRSLSSLVLCDFGLAQRDPLQGQQCSKSIEDSAVELVLSKLKATRDSSRIKTSDEAINVESTPLRKLKRSHRDSHYNSDNNDTTDTIAINNDNEEVEEEEEKEEDYPPTPPTITRWDGGLFHLVVTSEYRPPELLFGSRFHGSTVDIWSTGCVFAELIRARIALRSWNVHVPALAPLASAASKISSNQRSSLVHSVHRINFFATQGEADDKNDDEPPIQAESLTLPSPSQFEGALPPLQNWLPLFSAKGDGELSQLSAICEMMGPPSKNVWESGRLLPGFMPSNIECGFCGPKPLYAASLLSWLPSKTLRDSCCGSLGCSHGDSGGGDSSNSGDISETATSSRRMFHLLAVVNVSHWVSGRCGKTTQEKIDSLNSYKLLDADLDCIDKVLRLLAYDPEKRSY
jgi:serine/threonine protein kinase